MYAGEPASCPSGVTGTSTEISTSENRSASLRKTILVMSGGEGYVDFRLGLLNTGTYILYLKWIQKKKQLWLITNCISMLGKAIGHLLLYIHPSVSVLFVCFQNIFKPTNLWPLLVHSVRSTKGLGLCLLLISLFFFSFLLSLALRSPNQQMDGL